MRLPPGRAAAEAAAGVASGRVAAEARGAEQEMHAARPRGRGVDGVSVRVATLCNGLRSMELWARAHLLPTCRVLRAQSERMRLTLNRRSDHT